MVTDSVCRKGNMELMEKEEEIKFLNMEVHIYVHVQVHNHRT